MSIGPKKRRQAKGINIDDYSHIINIEEAKGLFDSMKYIYKIVLKFGSSETRRVKKLQTRKEPVESKEPNSCSTEYGTNSRVNEDSPDSDNSTTSLNERPSAVGPENSIVEGHATDVNEDSNISLNESGVLNITDTSCTNSDEENNLGKRLMRERKKDKRRCQFSTFDDRKEPTDYDLLNNFLLRAHKYLEKLDSAGRTFRQIFSMKEERQFEEFRYFIMNLEIYGSFLPISDRLYDPQVTRISSYLKVCKIRKGLDALINEFEEVEGKIFKDVWMKMRMISYNFNKIEAFLSRKHNQASHKKVDGKKSFFIDYDNENHLAEERKEPQYDFESTFGGTVKNSTSGSGFSVVNDDEDEYHYVKTLFKDFTEPDVMRSGHLIPLSWGHSGIYSKQEASLLETHLRQSGFI